MGAGGSADQSTCTLLSFSKATIKSSLKSIQPIYSFFLAQYKAGNKEFKMCFKSTKDHFEVSSCETYNSYSGPGFGRRTSAMEGTEATQRARLS